MVYLANGTLSTIKKSKPTALKQNMNEKDSHNVQWKNTQKVHLYEVWELIFDDENQIKG